MTIFIDPLNVIKVSEIYQTLNFSKCVNPEFQNELKVLIEGFEKSYHAFKYHSPSKNEIRKIEQTFLMLTKAVQQLYDALSIETQNHIEKHLAQAAECV